MPEIHIERPEPALIMAGIPLANAAIYHQHPVFGRRHRGLA